ncbi:ABC transporter ATP-binding protein [Salirhabdus salicampi]|uniref:ABC transporter ATP-binding protein n=1 Tax=Salirhabdus salicampi TaxID=476102 RepID=UPI0020C52322|nr:ABC transporter ATP-binding protein [Salirhabdus salicampi]MCP8615863.1 ABC transporter ATP-binding protein [Salirhabdus salicampi]
MSYVTIENLQFHYNGVNDHTIEHFNLLIERGEILSILGSSGSGKSTVLRLIAGLEIPSQGTIKINGEVMASKDHFIEPEKRGIGMVFQDYALFPHMTVGKNITYGLKKWSRLQKKERLQEMLSLVNLTNYTYRYPYELSGGQQQRVALARALAPNPSLLLLDEPFSNLDADLQNKIREELRDILKKTGITTIFVTHDQNDARILADKMVLLNQGKIEKYGNPCDMLISS